MFHHNRGRRSRTAATAANTGGPHSSDDEYDDEVFYREQSQTRGNVDNQGQGHLFGGLARFGSQSQTQPQRSQSPSVTSTTSSEAAVGVGTGAATTTTTGAAHPVLLMPRHERRRRAREMTERMNEYYQQGGSMSSSSESSQAESAAPENAFASLELLLNQQQEKQQQKQPEESSMVAPPPEPQIDLLPPDAHPAPYDENPIVEKAAVVEAHGDLHRSGPPTPLTVGSTSTAGLTNNPQRPLVPEAAPAHTATNTSTTTVPTVPSPRDDTLPNDSMAAHDQDDAGQAWIETDPSGGGIPEERNLAASQNTVHIASQVSTKTHSTKRSRGRDNYKHNVPTPSYTSFSPPGRNSVSSTTRRLANSQMDPLPNSLLEKTRRIAMKQAKSTAAAAAAAATANTRAQRSLGPTSSSTQQRSSLKPVSIVNSKSIVGTRYVSYLLNVCV
jgi:hypothetical protein